MKKFSLFVLIIMFLVSCDAEYNLIKPVDIDFDNGSSNLVVMSQNLRIIDDYLSTPQRALRFFELLKLAKPDIIGTQECTARMKACFRAGLLEEYDILGVSRNGRTANDGEWNVVLYRKDRFTLLDHGDFWLSDTPEKTSKLSDSTDYRICTWALLYDNKTEKKVLICNTHLDHQIPLDHQALQLKVILDFVANQYSDIPVFITGDFNSWLSSPAITLAKHEYLVSCETALENTSTVTGTYHAYGKTDSLIDFCLYKESFAKALEYHVWNNTFDGYISDHFAITTKFSLLDSD